MGHRRWAMHVAAAVAVVSMSTQANAGELGQISRGTISISLSVAPHVTVERAAWLDLDKAGEAGDYLCVASTGMGSFYVAVLGGWMAPEAVLAPPELQAGGAPDRSLCPPATAAGAMLIVDLSCRPAGSIHARGGT